MEVLPAARLQLLWEDIVYAVLAISHEDTILDHLQNCFKIQEEEFSDLKEIVAEAYKKPQIIVEVINVKVCCYPFQNEDPEGNICTIKMGKAQHQARESTNKMTWNFQEIFEVENMYEQRLEIEIWQDDEKDQKTNLGLVCLRSLDQFGKKLRSNLRSQTLTSFYPALSNDKVNNLAIKAGEGQDGTPLLIGQIKTEKEDPALTDDQDKRRDTFHVADSNWVFSAFTSLKRSSLKKRSLINNVTGSSENNYIDMRSPIPIGQESLTDIKRNWRFKSERSFFNNKENSKFPPIGSSGDKKDIEKGDIKTKPEIQVRRQLFRDFLTPTLEIPENEILHFSSAKIPLHEVKSLPKLHSINFQRTELKDESKEDITRSTLSSERKRSLTKGLSSPSLKSGTLNISAKSDFQLWKKMSVSSFREKISNSSSSDIKPLMTEQSDCSSSVKDMQNAKANTYLVQEQRDWTRNKTKTGSAFVDLKDVFTKMPCSEWTIDEEVDFTPTACNRTLSPVKSLSKAQVRLELRPRHTLSSMSAFNVFILCLKRILTIEIQLQVNEEEGIGMYLPLRRNSKLILKCLAFSYNLSEAHLSLACWLVLIQGHSLDYLFKTESTEDHKMEAPEEVSEDKLSVTDTQEELQEDGEFQKRNQKKAVGFCGEIHPKYFYHWLKKTESFVCGSSYNEKEEELIASSLGNFINSFCQQLERIHASFPINHTSHLQYGLRCICLLSESKGLQNIATKYGMMLDSSWPVSVALKSVLTHANNWINALSKEISIQNNDSSIDEQLAAEFHSEDEIKPKIVTQKTPLMQGIMNGEKAMLAVNDFVGLGDKVYETIFQKELNESYLELVWSTMTSILHTVLTPVQSVLHSNDIQSGMNRSTESLQDLHMYLWILLLQLSKLQRFQNAMEEKSDVIRLPETFTETFFLLSRLWLKICLLRIEETLDVECQADGLSSTDGDGISSSAREIIDVMHVINEKINRFSFPLIKKFKENLAIYLEEGLVPVVETYRRNLCHNASESASVSNMLTPKMSVALNNIEKVSVEAEGLICSLCPRLKESLRQITYLRTQTREASFCIFSKCLPRLQTWFANALSDKENEEFLVDWIKSIMDVLLEDYASRAKLYSILLQYFWDYIFAVTKENLEIIIQPKDFRFLGNFLEKLYYVFKVSLRVNLHSESEIEFKEFMKKIQLKASLTSEVIRIYYADRLKEQNAMKSTRKPLVINAYFCKNKGLKVVVYVCPSVDITSKNKMFTTPSITEDYDDMVTLSRRSAYDTIFDWKSPSIPREFRVSAQVKRKASSVIMSLTKSSATNFYVKVNLVPAEWFKKVSSKKTKCTQKNPPVFEDHLSFNVKPSDEGVLKGGFLLFRLKYSSVSSSAVDSEAILPLKDIPVMSSEDKLENKHTYLTMSAPSSLQDYETLQELLTRKQDKDAAAFVAQLQQSYLTIR